MNNDWVSLCLLSYKRPQFIKEAILSATADPGYPLEVIVHDDGSDMMVQTMLIEMLHHNQIGKLILNPQGLNQGVGEAARVAFGVASGRILVKADQDLIFRAGWARALVDVMDEGVTIAGLFKYEHEPVDHRKTFLKAVSAPGRTDYELHTHICASLFGITAQDLSLLGGMPTHSDAFAEDTELMTAAKKVGGTIALTREDFVTNRGFGIGPSTVVEHAGPDGVAKIHHQPLLWGRRARSAPAGRFHAGVVMPIGAGREGNVRRVIRDLDVQSVRPEQIVLVYDGIERFDVGPCVIPIRHVEMPKHRPGLEQPRNVGVAHLKAVRPECNYVWFLDSDIALPPETFENICDAFYMAPDVDRVLICPYEFLAPGQVGLHPEVKTDVRWPQFDAVTPADVFEFGKPEETPAGFNHGGACFSGNIVWPIADFQRIGGFWNEIHHGRCEDGEIGFRACLAGVKMSYAPAARGYHQYHPINMGWVLSANARDVPMINARHPYLKDHGMVVTEEDGRRFEQLCPDCGQLVNTLLWWEHRSKPCT